MVNSTERREVIKHGKKDDLNIKAAALSGVKKAEEKRFNVEILRYFNPRRQFAELYLVVRMVASCTQRG